MTPGVRPAGKGVDDHAQINDADTDDRGRRRLPCDRPSHPGRLDPAAAAAAILAEMQAAFDATRLIIRRSCDPSFHFAKITLPPVSTGYLVPFMVGVAQLVRAPDCGSGGRGFETRHPPQGTT